MPQSMGWQRVRHNLSTEQQRQASIPETIAQQMAEVNQMGENRGIQCLTESWDLYPLSLSLMYGCQFSSVQWLSCVRLFATPWTVAHQASLSITNSQSLLKLTSLEAVMASNHLILFRLLLLPSAFPSIRVFLNKSVLRIR